MSTDALVLKPARWRMGIASLDGVPRGRPERDGESADASTRRDVQVEDDITDEQKDAARDALAALKKAVPSVVDYTVGFDIERNPNNWDMVLVADFEDVAGARGVLRNPVMNAASDLVASVTQKEITARVQFTF